MRSKNLSDGLDSGRAVAAPASDGDTIESAAAERRAFELFARERRKEINVHCYRMMGSLADADDMTQETFVRAWRARGELSDETLKRPWLYRIATNACLDALRRRKRERILWGETAPTVAGTDLGTPDLNIDWLEPMPDSFLSDVADDALSPHAKFEQAETVRLAFLACVQRLPARQRAVFLLREVVGWSAAEVATAFEMSPQAVNSLLQRARRTFDSAYEHEPKWTAASDLDKQMAERYAAALERRDFDSFASMLHSDATLHMPPWRTWFKGRMPIRDFVTHIFQGYSGFRAQVFRANGRCAIAVYARSAEEEAWQPHAVHVLEISNGSVASIVAFVALDGASLFSKMGLPLEPSSS